MKYAFSILLLLAMIVGCSAETGNSRVNEAPISVSEQGFGRWNGAGIKLYGEDELQPIIYIQDIVLAEIILDSSIGQCFPAEISVDGLITERLTKAPVMGIVDRLEFLDRSPSRPDCSVIEIPRDGRRDLAVSP